MDIATTNCPWPVFQSHKPSAPSCSADVSCWTAHVTTSTGVTTPGSAQATSHTATLHGTPTPLYTIMATESMGLDLRSRVGRLEAALAPGVVSHVTELSAAGGSDEPLSAGIRAVVDASRWSDNERRVHEALVAADVRGAVMLRVRVSYYEVTLAERAVILQAAKQHLCKTLLMENVWWEGYAGATPPSTDEARYYSRYICVIIQYVARLRPDQLVKRLRWLGGCAHSMKSFKFTLAKEEVSDAMSGFAHNGVTPYGMKEPVPVVIAEEITKLDPPFMWLGGGDPDLKLRVPTAQLIRTLKPIVVNCTEPKGAGSGDDVGDDGEDSD